MHPDLRGVLIVLGLVVAALALKGCSTKYVPILKPGELAKVKSETVEPGKRPPARSPADTPLPEVEKQWGADRKGWGDEADRGDTARCILCAERDGKIINKKTGENTCRKLKC